MTEVFRRSLIVLALLGIGLAADVLAQGPGGFRGGPGGFGGGFGGGGGFDSPGFVVRREDVQNELGLTDEQKEQLSAQQNSFRDDPKMREFFDRMRNASEEERRAIGIEMREYSEGQIKSILKVDQYTRLQQLTLQRQGARALDNDEMAGQLKLSEQQRADVRKAIEEYDNARREIFSNRDLSSEERDARFEELRQKRDEAVEGVLSAQQKAQLDERRGATFTFQDTPGGGRDQRGRRREDENRQSPRRPTGTPMGSVVVVPEENTTGEPATVSFGVGKADGKRAEKLSFNFRFAPWVDVLKLFAEASGLTLDLNQVPSGTFNYYDEREYTPEEALDVLNGYLLQKGYVLVRRDEFLVVLNIDDPIPPNLVPTIPVSDLPKRGRNELLTIIIPLDGMTPADAAEEVRELLGPQGKVVALNKANRLVITDIGSNLRRIHELLTGLNVATGDKLFKQFVLKHIPAVDADNIVRDLFGLPRRGVENVSSSSYRGDSRYGDSRYGDSRYSSSSRSSSNPPNGTDPNARVQVAVDERTNTLLVTARPEDMKIVEEAITSLDVPATPGLVARGNKQPYLEVYQLKSADAQEVTKTLNVLYPGCVVNEDGRARRVHIHATSEQHEQIRNVIRRLDGEGGGTEVAVIPLGRIDAYTATASIQSLFLSEGTSAPVVQPHPLGTGLIVRGTTDQVAQIKVLLTQLDPTANGGASQQGNVRTIPLGGRDPEEFLRALEEIWNAKGRNPIRTRIPAAGPIRHRRVPGEEESTTTSKDESPMRRVLGTPTDAEERPTRTEPTGGANRNPVPSPGKNAELPEQDAAPQKKRSTSEFKSASLARPRSNATELAALVVSNASNADAVLDFSELDAADESQSDLTVALQEEGHPDADPVRESLRESAKKSLDGDQNKRSTKTQTPADEADVNAEFDRLFKTLDASADPAAAQEPESASDGQPASREANADEPAETSNPETPIVITIREGNLVVISDDEQALDRLEDVISLLSKAIPPKTQWTVFYLQSADAVETATVLERLFPTSSVSTVGSSSSGLLGELTSGISSMGRGLMDLTGLNTLTAGPQTLRIIPDMRTNSLFVSGPTHLIDEVEETLRILDASETPEQLRNRAPRYIEVKHAEVGEVADIIRDVYKEELEPERGQQNQGQNPLAALMGGGGGNSRGGSRSQTPQVKLTLGVDSRTSRLVVSCSEPLFRQIEQMVKQIDQASMEAQRTVRVVSLTHSNTKELKAALGAVMPRVRVSTNRSGGDSRSGGSPGGSGQGGSGGGPQPSAQPNPEELRQMFMQRMQQGGGGPPGGFGGSRGGFGFGGDGGRGRGGDDRR